MFKVGDKVKCVDDSGWCRGREKSLELGRIYTVTQVLSPASCTVDDDTQYGWSQVRFELAPPAGEWLAFGETFDTEEGAIAFAEQRVDGGDVTVWKRVATVTVTRNVEVTRG